VKVYTACTSNPTVEHTLCPVMYSDTLFASVFDGFQVGIFPAEMQPPKNTCTAKKDQRACIEKKTQRGVVCMRIAMTMTMTGEVDGCGMNGTAGTKWMVKWMRCGMDGMPQENQAHITGTSEAEYVNDRLGYQKARRETVSGSGERERVETRVGESPTKRERTPQ